MVNPVAVLKLMREKNQFVQNHPTFYSFLAENFGKGAPEGTTIEIKICQPNGEECIETVKLQESDVPLFGVIKEFFE